MTARPGKDLPADDMIANRIAQALSVEGGHLLVTEGGWALHFASGERLYGADLKVMRSRCARAGLPVIDCSSICFIGRLKNCIDWPDIAVGNPSDRHCWPSAPLLLAQAATIYAHEGAEVLNL